MSDATASEVIDLVSINEAMQILDASRSTVERLCDAGELTDLHVNTSRKVTRQSIVAYVNRGIAKASKRRTERRRRSR